MASQYYCNRPTTVRQEFTVKEGMDIYISSREGVSPLLQSGAIGLISKII